MASMIDSLMFDGPLWQGRNAPVCDSANRAARIEDQGACCAGDPADISLLFWLTFRENVLFDFGKIPCAHLVTSQPLADAHAHRLTYDRDQFVQHGWQNTFMHTQRRCPVHKI